MESQGAVCWIACAVCRVDLPAWQGILDFDMPRAGMREVYFLHATSPFLDTLLCLHDCCSSRCYCYNLSRLVVAVVANRRVQMVGNLVAENCLAGNFLADNCPVADSCQVEVQEADLAEEVVEAKRHIAGIEG